MTPWWLIRSWVLIALGVLIAAHTSDGISYDSTAALVLAVLLISLLNVFLRPLLMLFTLPFIVLTFGLGLVVINALIFYFAGFLVPGFEVADFWAALWAAVVVAICSLIVNLFIGGGGLKVRVDQSDPRRKAPRDDDVIDI